MSKSKMSVVVILSTIIAVTAMLKPELFSVQGIKDTKLAIVNDIKKVNFLSKDNNDSKNQRVKYNDVVQSSEIRVKDVNNVKEDTAHKNSNNKNSLEKGGKSVSKGGIILTDSAKKNKLEALHNSQLEDINNYCGDKYAQKDSSKKENSEKEISKETQKENNTKNEIAAKNDDKSYDKNDTSVFKVSKEEIKEKLTLGDKQKILSVARKLSPADYEKINQYISKEGDEQGVIDAVKLLRDRLSDKDYDKIKEVASKFLNMEVVEKK